MTTTLQDVSLTTIDGKPASLGDYAGQVLLIVNVASKCGLTPQYTALEALYQDYRDRGFLVLGFPANDFAGQEPGTDAEIAGFCQTSFAVDFPMFSKIAVTGAAKHPLYAALTGAKPTAEDPAGGDFRTKLAGYGMTPNPPPELLWNFEKFLVGKDGAVIARFTPDTPPDHPAVREAVEAALAA